MTDWVVADGGEPWLHTRWDGMATLYGVVFFCPSVDEKRGEEASAEVGTGGADGRKRSTTSPPTRGWDASFLSFCLERSLTLTDTIPAVLSGVHYRSFILTLPDPHLQKFVDCSTPARHGGTVHLQTLFLSDLHQFREPEDIRTVQDKSLRTVQ